jgi:histidine triad (HIT) family protein
MEDCIFCKIVRKEIPCVKVYENDKVLAFSDINPISDGHTLIIPKKHAVNIWEMEVEDLKAVQEAAKLLAHAAKEALNLLGVAFLQLNGKGVNQVVMHYHLHLIPRMEGSPEIELTAWELKPGDSERINEIAGKIASAIK